MRYQAALHPDCWIHPLKQKALEAPAVTGKNNHSIVAHPSPLSQPAADVCQILNKPGYAKHVADSADQTTPQQLKDPSQPVKRRVPLDPDSGDAWITAADGNDYWGIFGAAGLLAYHPDRGILLQHRAEWTSHGGTWGLPGGARHRNESAEAAALRETAEETGLNAADVTPLSEYTSDRGGWTYTTIIALASDAADCPTPNEETLEMRWVQLADVPGYNLHPGLASSWEDLLTIITATESLQR